MNFENVYITIFGSEIRSGKANEFYDALRKLEKIEVISEDQIDCIDAEYQLDIHPPEKTALSYPLFLDAISDLSKCMHSVQLNCNLLTEVHL